MIALSNFLYAIGMLLDMLLGTLLILVIARAIVSWVNADPYNPIVRFLISATDPLLIPLRTRLPLTAGNVDFSPIVLLLVIYFLRFFLAQSILDYAVMLKPSAVLP